MPAPAAHGALIYPAALPMESFVESQGPDLTLSLAAARALFRAPQAEDTCWADVHLPDGTVRACGRLEASTLGLCAEHRLELFGLEVSPVSGSPAGCPRSAR